MSAGMVVRVLGVEVCNRRGSALFAPAGGELLGDILDLSCIEADKRQLHPEEVDLAEEAAWVRRMTAPVAEKHDTRVSISQPDEIACIVWDRRALRQILINLTTNAAKYGGKRCEIVFRRAGPRDLTISVIDDGPGIDPDVQASLFQPFTRGGNAFSSEIEGSGLGLALCRRLVELGGGTIALDSALGRGTRVDVNLPDALCEASAGIRSERAVERCAS